MHAHGHPYISSSELIIIYIMIFNFYNSTAAAALRLIAAIVLAVTFAGMLTICTTCTCEHYVTSIYTCSIKVPGIIYAWVTSKAPPIH